MDAYDASTEAHIARGLQPKVSRRYFDPPGSSGR